METRRILATLDERRRWVKRKAELEKELRGCPPDELPLKKVELAKVVEQISYYNALLRDMKKDLRPSDRSSILMRG